MTLAGGSAPESSARSACVSCGASPRPLHEMSSGENGCSTGASRAAGPRTARANSVRRPRSFDPQLFEGAGVVGPVLAHLDPQIEVHAAPQQIVEREARGAADTLQALAARADDD